jgi:hypothetical protein
MHFSSHQHKITTIHLRTFEDSLNEVIHEDNLLNKEFDPTKGIISLLHVLGQATFGNTC